MPPSEPADTTAALSTIPPCSALSTTVPGHGWSSGHADTYPTGTPTGVMDTKFSEYASEAGTPQFDAGTGTTRGWFATSEGGPNGPVLPEPPTLRVSINRQGVVDTNTKPAEPFAVAALCAFAARSLRPGTAQFFTGTESGWGDCAKLATFKAAAAASATRTRTEPNLLKGE
jgi:hypothetical protein